MINVKFVENGHVYSGTDPDEVVEKMYADQWVSMSLIGYRYDVAKRLKERGILIRSDTNEHFVNDLLEQGVIRIVEEGGEK